MFRTLTSGPRLLVVLDNVRSVEQVRPPLPGSSSCAVIVISRHRISGLAVHHGADILDIDPLPEDDAVTVLNTGIGDRAMADHASTARTIPIRSEGKARGARFVNYRTDDAAHPASAVYERLIQLFGTEQVFRDSRSLVPGEHSPSRIRAALRTADALVAVIGPTWLDHRDNGRRALDLPDDWVRREIATALDRGIPVLPVFVDDTARPPKDRLPADLHGLRQSQAHRIRHQTPGPDIDAIGTALFELVPTLLLKHLFLQPPQLSENPLPSTLLRPEYGIMPFEGRQHELADLLAWCRTSAPLSAHLVTAPAGEGKTRLADELADELRRDRWLTGVLLEDTPPDRVADPTRLDRPILLIINYVEGRVGQLRALAEGVIAGGASHPPVRLLLLGRSAGDWLAQARTASGDTFHGLFVNAGRLPLGPLVRPTDRHAEFTRAVQAFAGYLNQATDDVVTPTDLADPRFDRALDVHAAALACLLDQTESGAAEQNALDPGRQSAASRAAVLAGLLDAGRQRRGDHRAARRRGCACHPVRRPDQETCARPARLLGVRQVTADRGAGLDGAALSRGGRAQPAAPRRARRGPRRRVASS